MANNEIKVKGNYEWIFAVIYIAIGALFIYFKTDAINWLIRAIGGAFILLGIVEIIQKNLPQGISSTVIGVILVIAAFFKLIIPFAMIALGAVMAIKSVMDLIPAIKSKKAVPMVTSGVTLLIGALLVLAGLGQGGWALKFLYDALNVIFVIIGVIFVVNGILKLVSFFQLKKANN